MKELKCVAIALNKGDLLFYDQPLTISVEKLIPENKPDLVIKTHTQRSHLKYSKE